MLHVKRLLLVVGVGVLSLAVTETAIYSQGDDKIKKELKALEGTWKEQTRIVDDEKEALDENNRTSFVFSGGTVKFFIADKENTLSSGDVVLDLSKTPRRMEIRAKDERVRQIYELKGDVLKVATVNDVQTYPAKFSGKGVQVSTYKKIK
jgi:uncharacterized protein (TIGR03067 family)